MNEIQEKIDNIFKARNDFFDLMDSKIPKKPNTDIFDFDACDPLIKEIYSKFYVYDYSLRKFLPEIYKKFNVSN